MVDVALVLASGAGSAVLRTEVRDNYNRRTHGGLLELDQSSEPGRV